MKEELLDICWFVHYSFKTKLFLILIFNIPVHVVFIIKDSAGRHLQWPQQHGDIFLQSFVQLAARIPLSCRRKGWCWNLTVRQFLLIVKKRWNIEYYKTLRQFLPNTKTMLLAVPARSPYLGEGSLAVVRVLQDPPRVSRISVESSLVL